MRIPSRRFFAVSMIVIAYGACSSVAALGQAITLSLPEDDPFKNAEPVCSIAFSPDGKLIATGHRGSGLTILWDARSGERMKVITSLKDEVRSVVFSPDGKSLAVLELPGTIRLIAVPEGNEIRKFELNDEERMFYAVAYFPNGKQLAAGVAASIGRPGSDVQIIDVATGKVVRTLVGHTGTVASVAVSPDGKLLASGAYDGTARIWDALTGKPQKTLKFLELRKEPEKKKTAEELQMEEWSIWVRSVEFSPDGLTLAASAGDIDSQTGEVVLWEIATAKPKATLKVDDFNVQQAMYSPDGTLIVTAGADGLTKRWEAATFKAAGKFEGSYPVAFSPDGKTIAAAIDTRTVVIRKCPDPK